MRKTSKDRQTAHMAQERQTGYEKMLTGPRPKTWSARMPAYCYTELCPEPELRRYSANEEENDG